MDSIEENLKIIQIYSFGTLKWTYFKKFKHQLYNFQETRMTPPNIVFRRLKTPLPIGTPDYYFLNENHNKDQEQKLYDYLIKTMLFDHGFKKKDFDLYLIQQYYEMGKAFRGCSKQYRYIIKRIKKRTTRFHSKMKLAQKRIKKLIGLLSEKTVEQEVCGLDQLFGGFKI